jgi:hypothetical protein
MQVLQDDFGHFLSKVSYPNIKLMGPFNHIVTCRLGFNDENEDKVKIGKGSKKFVPLITS